MSPHNAIRSQEFARAPNIAGRFTIALGLALALLAPAPAHSQVTLKINNKSGGPVCVMWTGVSDSLQA